MLLFVCSTHKPHHPTMPHTPFPPSPYKIVTHTMYLNPFPLQAVRSLNISPLNTTLLQGIEALTAPPRRSFLRKPAITQLHHAAKGVLQSVVLSTPTASAMLATEHMMELVSVSRCVFVWLVGLPLYSSQHTQHTQHCTTPLTQCP